MVGRGGGGA
uniref:Uncharacterized protein n=1 Tax=Arundo donax TaxID=35708 RepID=A0A0A9HCK0_ARUDO